MNEDNEVDLYQFAKLFDAAIASNNPGVKKALRNFMLVASIAEAEQDAVQRANGLVSVFDRVSSLERDVKDLQLTLKNAVNSKQYIGNSDEIYKSNNEITEWYNNRYGYNNGTSMSTNYTIPKNSALYSTFNDIINSKEGKP